MVDKSLAEFTRQIRTLTETLRERDEESEDLQGVITHLKQDRDKERARARRAEIYVEQLEDDLDDMECDLDRETQRAKRLEEERDGARKAADSARERSRRHAEKLADADTEIESWRAMDKETRFERDHFRALWEGLREEFDKYREYTTAGFKTLYDERRYGPPRGAPGTEGLLDDVDRPWGRLVVYRHPRKTIEPRTVPRRGTAMGSLTVTDYGKDTGTDDLYREGRDL